MMLYVEKPLQNYAKKQDLVISGMRKEKISPTALFFKEQRGALTGANTILTVTGKSEK